MVIIPLPQASAMVIIPCRRLQLWSSSLAAGFSYGHHPLPQASAMVIIPLPQASAMVIIPCRRLQPRGYGHHPLAAGFSYGHHPLAAGFSYGHHPLPQASACGGLGI